MGVSLCNTASHSLCWEGAQKLKFCMKFVICCWQKWHIKAHWGLIYAITSSFEHSYTSKEDYEAVKLQWMSLLVAQHHTPFAERVRENWNFAWNLRCVVGRNDTLWTMRVSYMLSEALSAFCIHPRKVMKHFINNRYLPLQHSSTFSVLRGCSKSQICLKFDVCYW